MDSVNMEKMDYFWQFWEILHFRTKDMDLHPPTAIPLLLIDSCRKNKIRTNEPELHWKNKNSDPQPKLSGPY